MQPSPASLLPRPLPAALGRPGRQVPLVRGGVTRVGTWPCPVPGLGRRRQEGAFPVFSPLSQFLSYFTFILRSFRSFRFEPLFLTGKVELGWSPGFCAPLSLLVSSSTPLSPTPAHLQESQARGRKLNPDRLSRARPAKEALYLGNAAGTSRK